MSNDQVTTGTDVDVPCPWCGEPQDLSMLEIAVDAQVTCDGCDRVYTLTAIEHVIPCPRCKSPKPITSMEVAEDAVIACEKCHTAFRPAALEYTTTVSAERAE